MLFRASIFFLFLSLALLCDAYANTIHVTPKQDLQSEINSAHDSDTLLLSAGTWSAKPTSFHDPLCGNCINPEEGASATYGFLITKALTVIGDSTRESLLATNAGYGLFIAGTGISVTARELMQPDTDPPTPRINLKYLVITNGKRDADGRATDAGIVCRKAPVIIDHCKIVHNTHRIDSVVVGIAGIVGREQCGITVTNTEITDNGWDGIALYRGAYLFATNVYINEGRGVGVGITWNSQAQLENVRVSHYWKGIGSFGSSKVHAGKCVIRDNLGWGLIATGTSELFATHIAILRNGNCGAAIWLDSASLVLDHSLIVGNGWKKQWVVPRVGFWRAGSGFAALQNNLFWNNDSGATAGMTTNIFNDTSKMYISTPEGIGYIANIESDPGAIDSCGFPVDSTTWKWKDRAFGPTQIRTKEEMEMMHHHPMDMMMHPAE